MSYLTVFVPFFRLPYRRFRFFVEGDLPVYATPVSPRNQLNQRKSYGENRETIEKMQESGTGMSSGSASNDDGTYPFFLKLFSLMF